MNYFDLMKAITYAHVEAQGLSSVPKGADESAAPGTAVGKVGLVAIRPNGPVMQPRSESQQNCAGLRAEWGIPPGAESRNAGREGEVHASVASPSFRKPITFTYGPETLVERIERNL